MTQRLDGISMGQRKVFEPFRPVVEATFGGFLPNSLFIMAHNPDLTLGFGLLARAVFRGSKRTRISIFSILRSAIELGWRSMKARRAPPIPDDLRALIFLAVSLSAGCRYCQAQSVTQALDRGVDQDKIKDILVYNESPHYSPPERAAIALAFAAGKAPNATTDLQFAELRCHFTNQQVVDVVAAIAYMGFLNRWNDTFSTMLEDRPCTVAAETLKTAEWEPGKHA